MMLAMLLRPMSYYEKQCSSSRRESLQSSDTATWLKQSANATADKPTSAERKDLEKDISDTSKVRS